MGRSTHGFEKVRNEISLVELACAGDYPSIFAAHGSGVDQVLSLCNADDCKAKCCR